MRDAFFALRMRAAPRYRCAAALPSAAFYITPFAACRYFFACHDAIFRCVSLRPRVTPFYITAMLRVMRDAPQRAAPTMFDTRLRHADDA